MLAAKQYSFYPDIGKRRYSDIADHVSIAAIHVFELMREHLYSAPFSFDQIEKIVTDTGHSLSISALEECLSELEQLKCLIVEEQLEVGED